MTEQDRIRSTNHGRRTTIISAPTFVLGAAVGVASVTSFSLGQDALQAAPSMQRAAPPQAVTEAGPTLQDLISQRSPGGRTASELTATKRTRQLSSASPIPSPTSAVPEPQTWAMMLVGFGAIGLSLRRTRTSRRRRSA